MDVVGIGVHSVTVDTHLKVQVGAGYITAVAGLGNHPFVVVQNEYSLATRKNEDELLGFNRQFGIAPMTWGSLGQGVLSGKYGRDVHFDSNDRRSRAVYENFYGEKLERNLKIVEVLRDIAAAHGKSVPAVAIRWILDYLPDSLVVVGAKRPTQVEQNAEAMGWCLSPDEITRLEKISGGRSL